MPELDDLDCLRAWHEHHNDFAFATLVERYRAGIYACCRQLLGDPAAADDACQAVFCVLARKAPELIRQGIGRRRPLAGWLFTTARLTVRNLQRQRGRRQHHEQLAGTDRITKAEPVDRIEVEERQQALHQALARLPRGNREALEQRYLLGRSPRQVAAALDIGEEALKKRLQRGLQHLRRQLAGRFPELGGAGLVALLTALPDEASAAPADWITAVSDPSPGIAALSQGVAQQLSLVAATKTLALAALALLSVSGVLSWPFLQAAEPTGDPPVAAEAAAPRLAWQLPVGTVFHTESVLDLRFTPTGPLPLALPVLQDLLADTREVSLWRWEVVGREADGALELHAVPLCGWLVQGRDQSLSITGMQLLDADGKRRVVDFSGQLSGIGPMGGPVTWRLDPATGALAVVDPDRRVEQDYGSVLGNCGLPGLILGLRPGPLDEAVPVAWEGFGAQTTFRLQAAEDAPYQLRSKPAPVTTASYALPRFMLDTGAGVVGIDLDYAGTGTATVAVDWSAERGLPTSSQSRWELAITLTGTGTNHLQASIGGDLVLERRCRLLDLDLGAAWPRDAVDLLQRYQQERLAYWCEEFDSHEPGSLVANAAASVLASLTSPPVEDDSLWRRWRAAQAADF